MSKDEIVCRFCGYDLKGKACISVIKEEVLRSYCLSHESELNIIVEHILEQKDPWISVEDRLPEDYDEVLVVTHAHKNIDGMQCAYMTDSEWCDPGLHCDVEIDGFVVTHWRPLPKPPKRK